MNVFALTYDYRASRWLLAKVWLEAVSCPMVKEREPRAPPIECAVCGEQMKHLADLHLTVAFPASRLYRCFGCDHVEQRAW